MAEIHEPVFMRTKKFRHLAMSMDFFLENQHNINKILDAFLFDSEREVTRIETEEENLVEFVQSLNGDKCDIIETYFNGSGEEAYH